MTETNGTDANPSANGQKNGGKIFRQAWPVAAVAAAGVVASWGGFAVPAFIRTGTVHRHVG